MECDNIELFINILAFRDARLSITKIELSILNLAFQFVLRNENYMGFRKALFEDAFKIALRLTKLTSTRLVKEKKINN